MGWDGGGGEGKVKWELVYGSPTTVDPVRAVGAIYKSAALGGQTDGLGEGKEKKKQKKFVS